MWLQESEAKLPFTTTSTLTDCPAGMTGTNMVGWTLGCTEAYALCFSPYKFGHCSDPELHPATGRIRYHDVDTGQGRRTAPMTQGDSASQAYISALPST
jgi:hypothetical protein